MIKLYIDESGSLNNVVKSPRNKYFVIAVLYAKKPRELKNSFKRFIKKNYKMLKNIDKDNKMFDSNGKFLEMKGSALTPEIKTSFLDYICVNDAFKVFYVKVHNQYLSDRIVENKEVGFNYILDKLLTYKISKGYLPQNESYLIQLDQRSVATRLQYTLEGFLLKSLTLDNELIKELELHYRDSQDNYLVQIADFFANLIYSSCYTKRYNKIIAEKRKEGYISHDYNFPYKNRK